MKTLEFFLKNKICIPAHEIFIGSKDEIGQRIPTTYLGDKLFDNSSSVLLASSSSTTEDDQEEDITYFEIGGYPVIDTANRDQATIEPSDKILPDSALDNTVSNHICEKFVEVGSSSFNPTKYK